ncbi:CADM4-like protein [Mya arenaria]|uniref:CADM4-like protein n=1 Tax=Mya arenaria TaxID=6604 RepID=A0ABY7FDT1_MYAAR|nr:CADM4-like protein [Mya arenaria]
MLSLNLRITFVVIVVCRMYAGADGSVTISSSEVTVPEGLSLTLTCNYTGIDKLYVIRWTNNGKDSGHKYDITIEQSEPCTIFGKPGLDKTLFTYTCFTLTILNVTRDNQNDNLTCQANLNFNSGNSVIVSVSDAPSDPPVIEGYASGGTYNMIENSIENLTCSSSGGNPLANLTWSCFNNQMSSPIEQGRTVKRVVQWTARRNENARCTCTASHAVRPNKHQTAFVNVNILYSPSTPLFKLDNTAVGSSIRIVSDTIQTVECDSSGNPYPTTSDFTWIKGTNVVGTGPVLNWPGGVMVGDDGSYTCTVETTLTPSDQNPPKLQTFTRESALEGYSFMIQCVYSVGNPARTKSTITRLFNGTSWSGDSHTMHSINRADAGLHRCTVENTMDPTGADTQTGTDTADFEINAHPDLQTITVSYDEISLDSYTEIQESDNLGFNAAVTYEIMPVEKESTDYDALKDPVYKNTKRKNSMQKNL